MYDSYSDRDIHQNQLYDTREKDNTIHGNTIHEKIRLCARVNETFVTNISDTIATLQVNITVRLECDNAKHNIS